MATLADLQTRIDAAVAALDASSWADAMRLADGALLLLVGIPDSRFDGYDEIKFDRQGAAEILKSVKRRANAQLVATSGNGFGANDIEYQRG